MGQTLSTRPAEEKAEEAQKSIETVLKSFEDKRNLYLEGMRESRGPNATYKTTEVTGGRTVMEYSEIFYTESIGPNSEITDAVGDFFSAADAAIDGDNKSAQHKAISGVASLIMAAINGIIGSTEIGVREMKTFVVLFLNNSFVRIDYVFFQQNIDVVKYLAAVRSTARLVVAEVAVLPIEAMEPSEISYLLSQAYTIPTSNQPSELCSEFAELGKLQTSIVQLNVLTRMLQEFLHIEDSKEDEVNGNSSIVKKSEALVSLSENVNKVLVNIRSPLPTSVEYSAELKTLAPEKEQAIKHRYMDADLDARAIIKFFTSKQKIAGSIQDSEKSNILLLLKKTYVKFEEAYDDCSDTTEVTYSKEFTSWFNESNADFGMWWYTFQKAADAITEADKTKGIVFRGSKTWGAVAGFDSTSADSINAAALEKLKNKYKINKTDADGKTVVDTRKLKDFSDYKVRKAFIEQYIKPDTTNVSS